METEKSVTWRVHQGRNIRRIRLEKNINQDVMAQFPVEKIVELYERMLKEEKEKYDSLEKRLAALEQKNK